MDEDPASGDVLGAKTPALCLSLCQLDNHSPAIQHFESCELAFCPVEVRIDEEWAMALLTMVRNADIWGLLDSAGIKAPASEDDAILGEPVLKVARDAGTLSNSSYVRLYT